MNTGKHLREGYLIYTRRRAKPIPDRRYDWSAALDSYDAATDCTVRLGRNRGSSDPGSPRADQIRGRAMKKHKDTYKAYPPTEDIRSGCKVGWRTYATRKEAEACCQGRDLGTARSKPRRAMTLATKRPATSRSCPMAALRSAVP